MTVTSLPCGLTAMAGRPFTQTTCAKWTLPVCLDFEASGLGVALLPMVRRMTAKAAPVSYANLKKLLERSEGQPAAAR